MAGKTKLIKGPDGKYYTPTAYKNQWGKIPAGSAYDVETPKVVRIDSNSVPSQPRTVGGITGAGAKNVGKVYRMGGEGGIGGVFGIKNR